MSFKKSLEESDKSFSSFEEEIVTSIASKESSPPLQPMRMKNIDKRKKFLVLNIIIYLNYLILLVLFYRSF